MKTIEIIGGGIAGLALGIALRQRLVPVTLWEAGGYPRHRVCGDFISGAGQDVLERMGLRNLVFEAGAVCAETGLISVGLCATRVRRFPNAAWCISRYRLDAALALEFQRRGGRLFTASRRSDTGPGVVRATGRRVQPPQAGGNWYGLKAHAEGVQLEADLELHAVPSGYVGVCRLGGDRVNICGLFHRGSGHHGASKEWQAKLRGEERSVLNRRLCEARFDPESFCATAGLAYNRQTFPGDCSIGDAFALSPPATGNGISKALESAWLAAGPLAEYSAGTIPWESASAEVGRLCIKAFGPRLAWGRGLHRLFVSRAVRSCAGAFLLRSTHAWSIFFKKTRSVADLDFFAPTEAGKLHSA